MSPFHCLLRNQLINLIMSLQALKFGLPVHESIYTRNNSLTRVSESKTTPVKITARVYVILSKSESQRLDLSIRHRDKHKIVLLRSLWLEKITNRTYVRKSRFAKHGLGYRDVVCFKWQRHDHRNPTKKHLLKSHNLTSLLEVT